MNLEELGWNDFYSRKFETHKSQGFLPARIAREDRERYTLLSELGELTGEITGKMRYSSESRLDFPAVGDWVAITPFEKSAVIHAVLPRKSKFLRKAAGTRTDEQIVASNIDILFLVMGLDNDFNLRRLERYLVSARESGAEPVVVLNKADLCENIELRLKETKRIASGVEVNSISAKDSTGIGKIGEFIKPGLTAAFLGSSGVGKSTIINALLGEERLLTREVREDDQRGRHTTTWREMILLPDGGIVIDTPGMRELKLWTDDENVRRAFEDILQLAEKCKFADCMHREEPGCAVQNAIESGELDEARYRSYLKMLREIEFLERRQSDKPNRDTKDRWKKIQKQRRQLNQYRNKHGIKR